MSRLAPVWRSRNITRSKINLVYALVFSVFGYAAETWTLRAADRRRVDAFEMWCWERMLRIPWTARRTNISILSEIQPKQRLSSLVYSRILKFFGYITRGDNMERLIVQGKPDGKRRRGRSPCRWLDAVEQLLHADMETAVRGVANRSRWRDSVRRAVAALDGARDDFPNVSPHVCQDVGFERDIKNILLIKNHLELKIT